MTFDRRDIRPSMDVYTLDNIYLGSVLGVIAPDVAIPHGRPVEAARQTSAISGELLGPAPTEPIGNPAPRVQSAAARYATGSDGARSLAGGAIWVGKWHGLIGRRLIPIEAIQTVSLERIVLRVTAAELDGAPSRGGD